MALSACELFTGQDDPAFTLVGSGDIAHCPSQGDELTAALLDSIPGTVFTTGDNAYPQGTLDDFLNCYEPSWGRHKERTRPSLGNHEYDTGSAAGYFAYFGAQAGRQPEGYYSYQLGDWTIAALNTNIDISVGSEQLQWLRGVLGASRSKCSLVYMHHPRFSSGRSQMIPWLEPLWNLLYEMGADVVLAGHDHLYERFAPQTPAGELDNAGGIRQFIVGTGGINLYPFIKVLPNSETRINDRFGVLKLDLTSGEYTWQFIATASQSAPPGEVLDSGADRCR